MSQAWKHVIVKIGKGLLLAGLPLGSAFVAAPYVSDCLSLSAEEIKIFRVVALGMVAWGVLGKSSWEIPVFVNIVVARAYAALFNSGCSFSGFNQTFSGNSQFLISPRHRFG